MHRSRAITKGWPVGGAFAVTAIPWTPFALGSALLAFWDAQVLSSFTFNTTNVASWTDQKASIVASQGTGSIQPSYSATSFNGGPGVTFDGFRWLSWGTGMYAATNIEMAGALSLTDNATRTVFGGGGGCLQWYYGAVSSNTAPALNKELVVGLGTSSAVIAPATAHIASAAYDGATCSFSVNGGTINTASSSNSITTQQTAIGVNGASGFREYFSGTIGTLLVTTILNTTNRNLRDGYLAWHTGLQASLPVGHPYKSAAPTMSAQDIERLFDEGMYFRDARYRRAVGLPPVTRRKLYMPPRLILPKRLAA